MALLRAMALLLLADAQQLELFVPSSSTPLSTTRNPYAAPYPTMAPGGIGYDGRLKGWETI